MTVKEAAAVAHQLQNAFDDVLVRSHGGDDVEVVAKTHTRLPHPMDKRFHRKTILRSRNVMAVVVSKGDKRFLRSPDKNHTPSFYKVLEYVKGTEQVLHTEV